MSQKVMCLLGPMKSGKSHSLLCVAAAMSHKHKVLVVSFEEKIAIIFHRLEDFGANLENIRVTTFDIESDVGKALKELSDHLNSYNEVGWPFSTLCIDNPFATPTDYPLHKDIAEKRLVDVYYTAQMHRKIATRRRPRK